jgi:hypothetical protein
MKPLREQALMGFRTKRQFIRWIVAIAMVVGALDGSPALAADPAKGAMKQVSQALKDVRGVEAEIVWVETVRERPREGRGKIYVSFDGWVRAEVGGESRRVVLFVPPYLYEHRVQDKRVEIYNVLTNPHRLGQYILLGFVPAGTAMKKKYEVSLIPNAILDGNPTTSFLLGPKDDEVSSAIARIGDRSGRPLRERHRSQRSGHVAVPAVLARGYDRGQDGLIRRRREGDKRMRALTVRTIALVLALGIAASAPAAAGSWAVSSGAVVIDVPVDASTVVHVRQLVRPAGPWPPAAAAISPDYQKSGGFGEWWRSASKTTRGWAIAGAVIGGAIIVFALNE